MANLFVIRDLSERKKITLREIANSVSISEDGLQKIMKSGRTNTDTLERIAKVLNVPVGYFFDEDISNENSITQKGGKSNAASIYGDALSGNIEVEYLKKMLEDKEDIIRILKKQLNYDEN